MKRYYITDRIQVGGVEALLESIRRNLVAGADMIQIREKDLSARELTALVRSAAALPNPRNVPLLVNDRVDIAVAAGLAGVHLPSSAMPPAEVRRITGRPWIIGVSCHTVDEVQRAALEGADFVVFGPVFAPLSKTSYSAPKGLSGLEEAARCSPLPIYALGGITPGNAVDCIRAGAAGIAGITMFQLPGCTLAH